MADESITMYDHGDNASQPGANKFYENGKKYWQKVAPDVNGMLGGFGEVSCTDVTGSTKFLGHFLNKKSNPINSHRALDCGAGIGRVTKHLLLEHFDHVDMIEQNQLFLDESYKYIEDEYGQIERRICSALQDFTPEDNRYDVIWCQWVLSHVIDEDVVQFLQRCGKGLTKNGLLIVKDNVTSSEEIEMDESDSTVSRPLNLWHDLIKRGGYEITLESKQTRFPKELYEVRMFACELRS